MIHAFDQPTRKATPEPMRRDGPWEFAWAFPRVINGVRKYLPFMEGSTIDYPANAFHSPCPLAPIDRFSGCEDKVSVDLKEILR